MPDSEDRTLHGLLVGIGGVAVGIGVLTRWFGAEATLGALMMTLGATGFIPHVRPPAARIVKTTPSHQA